MAQEKEQKRESTQNATGVKLNVGLSPALLDKLKEIGAVGLIDNLFRTLVNTVIASKGLDSNVIKHAVDKAAETLQIAQAQDSAHIKVLLEKDFIQSNLKEITLYTGIEINLFNQDSVNSNQNSSQNSVDELLKRMHQKFLEKISKNKGNGLSNEDLKDWILPDLTESANPDSKRVSFYECLLQEKGFLKNDEPLLLLLGDSGVGKSLTLRHVASLIWYVRGCLSEKLENVFQHIKPPEEMNQLLKYVPLIVDLKNLDGAPEDFIPWVLDKHYHYTEDEIRILRKECHFLLLLDGYDELRGVLKGSKNFYQDAKLGKDGWRCKSIITCRSQYLTTLTANDKADYKSYFSLISNKKRTFPCELWLAPFSKKQVELYLDRIKIKEADKAKEIQEKFEQFSSLYSLASFPLILKMLVAISSEISDQPDLFGSTRDSLPATTPAPVPTATNTHTNTLPALSSPAHQLQAVEITRALIYEIFTKKWFEHESNRLKEVGKLGQFENLDDESLRSFVEELAFEMFKSGEEKIPYSQCSKPSRNKHAKNNKNTISNESIWDKFFSIKIEKNEHDQHTEKRIACPLTYVENCYSFYHKSFLEYFTASYFYRQDLGLEDKEEHFNDVLEALKGSGIDFNQKLLTTEPRIVHFLAEMIRTDSGEVKSDKKVERLFSIVNASKDSSSLSIAAANAITILNYARIPFSEKELNCVNIQNADLSNAILDNTSFYRANLQGVTLLGAFLRGADLTGANLKKAKFSSKSLGLESNEEFSISKDKNWYAKVVDKEIQIFSYKKDKNPETFDNFLVLKGHTHKISCVKFDPNNNNRIASGSWDKTIRIWNAKTGEIFHIFTEHTDCISCLVFDPKNNRIASGSWDKTIIIWDLNARKRLFKLEGHTHVVSALAFNVNGTKILSGIQPRINKWTISH